MVIQFDLVGKALLFEETYLSSDEGSAERGNNHKGLGFKVRFGEIQGFDNAFLQKNVFKALF